jgi:hypothetical protein
LQDGDEIGINNSFKENKPMDIDDQMSNTHDQSFLNKPEHPILNAFATDIISNLIRLSRPTSLSYPEQLGHNVIPVKSVVPTITESLAMVHLRAVECMNNFFLTMVDIVEEKWWFTKHRDAAKYTWTKLVEVANQVAGKGIKVGAEDPGQKMRGTVLEALVGCLWTLARGLNGDVVYNSFFNYNNFTIGLEMFSKYLINIISHLQKIKFKHLFNVISLRNRNPCVLNWSAHWEQLQEDKMQ